MFWKWHGASEKEVVPENSEKVKSARNRVMYSRLNLQQWDRTRSSISFQKEIWFSLPNLFKTYLTYLDDENKESGGIIYRHFVI
jgi:hypothetical protein